MLPVGDKVGATAEPLYSELIEGLRNAFLRNEALKVTKQRRDTLPAREAPDWEHVESCIAVPFFCFFFNSGASVNKPLFWVSTSKHGVRGSSARVR